jgi:hypothetical protein
MNDIFFHVATIGRYQSIVDELVYLIDNAKFDNIFVGIVGDGLVNLPKNYNILFRKKIDQYEFPTLEALQNHCLKTECNVLYIHTKGASSEYNEAIEDWRKYMSYFLIERSNECFEFLKHNDVCGVDWRKYPVQHFSVKNPSEKVRIYLA